MLILPMMDMVTICDSNDDMKKDFIYICKDNHFLKLYITIDSDVLKENFVKFYNAMKAQSTDFRIVSERELKNYSFPVAIPCVGKPKLNRSYKQTAYQIPGQEDGQILHNISHIYKYNYQKSNEINLDMRDIEELYNELCESSSTPELYNIKKEVILDIISSLNVQLVKKYDYEKLYSSVENILHLISSSYEFKSNSDVSKLKRILEWSKSYGDTFDKLGISIPDKDLENKTKKYAK